MTWQHVWQLWCGLLGAGADGWVPWEPSMGGQDTAAPSPQLGEVRAVLCVIAVAPQAE